jgi:hypothetical protein
MTADGTYFQVPSPLPRIDAFKTGVVGPGNKQVVVDGTKGRYHAIVTLTFKATDDGLPITSVAHAADILALLLARLPG